MADKVSINGEIMEPSQAKISVFDRGFLYGDAVYEVTRSYGRILFQLEAHLDRLFRSADAIGMDLGISRADLINEIYRTVNSTGSENQYMRIQISRGSGPISIIPDASTGTTRVIYAKPMPPYPASFYSAGVPIGVSTLWRNSRNAMDPNIKSGNYLNNILAIRETLPQIPHETLLLNSDGRVTEGCTSNIFLVKNQTLITPPDHFDILWGITRAITVDLAKKKGFQVKYEGFTIDELLSADEVFITSSTREIMPVATIQGRAIRSSPGEVTRQLMFEYKNFVREYCDAATTRHPWNSR